MFRQIILIDNPRAEFDITSLEEHGTLVNVRYRLTSPFLEGKFENRLLETLDLVDFDPRRDAVAVIGRQTQLCMSMITIAQRYDEFCLLLYSNSEHKYVVRKVQGIGEDVRRSKGAAL